MSSTQSTCPKLCLIVPCFNEEAVLPVTSREFKDKLEELIRLNQISSDSRILFVDDGSYDRTWELICGFAESSPYVEGISLSRNRGHQNALLAGLMEVKGKCDIAVTIDCDGQDDLDVLDEMVKAYRQGYEIVYGVRADRRRDDVFKRITAKGFYRLMGWMGAEIVGNHGDYRLVSSRVLEELADFKEVNLFLRGIIPFMGFKSTSVYYERRKRIAGESHYPLRKMAGLAFDGITSFSIRPLRMIAGLGGIIAFFSFIWVIWSAAEYFSGNTVSGWASMVGILMFLNGIQLVCVGVLGEYIGKIYLETKGRPRYIIRERTGKGQEE